MPLGPQYFELKQDGFKYSHDSYYFDVYQKADKFIEEVKNIENDILIEENYHLYARKLDILTQSYAMKKSVHIIYPFFPIRQSELDQASKFDKSLLTKPSMTKADLERLNSNLEYPLFGRFHYKTFVTLSRRCKVCKRQSI